MKEKGIAWEQYFAPREAEGLMEEGGVLHALAHSEEIRRLGELLGAQGERAEQAANEAIRGNGRALEAMLSELSGDPEGAAVIARLRARLGQ